MGSAVGIPPYPLPAPLQFESAPRLSDYQSRALVFEGKAPADVLADVRERLRAARVVATQWAQRQHVLATLEALACAATAMRSACRRSKNRMISSRVMRVSHGPRIIGRNSQVSADSIRSAPDCRSLTSCRDCSIFLGEGAGTSPALPR